MKTYRGWRSARGAEVTVEEAGRRGHRLRRRGDLYNHSPNGFEWGYGGSGPAQLALALLADALGDDERALQLHQDFKWEIVASLPKVSWLMTDDQVREVAATLNERRS